MSKIIISTLAIVLIFSLAIAKTNAQQKGAESINIRKAVTQSTDAPQPNIPQLINYQGRLTDNAGNPQNGNFNMTFRIYDDSTGGILYWTETQPNVTVNNGLFNVFLGSVNPIAPITELPQGPNCYLEITVGTELISPRQRIVSNAYSYYADEARVGVADNAWVRGTPDSVLFTIRQLGIARGGAGNTLWGDYRYTHTNLGVACTTGTPGENQSYATVGGGYGNKATYWCATVGGGTDNTAGLTYATVGGGASNTAAWGATVAGGTNNTASNSSATVGGGNGNTASGSSATVGGGYGNTASGGFATTVGGGDANTASGYITTIGGGKSNTASGSYATVGGGDINTASGSWATVAGGDTNTASDSWATVGGGLHNNANNRTATIPGGCNNTASGWSATVGGGG